MTYRYESDPERLAAGLVSQDQAAVDLVVEMLRAPGDSQGIALAAVARAFYPPVMPFIRRRVGRDEGRAQEIWVDTLVRVYTGAGRYDQRRASFRTWVFNQAHYALLDAARAALRTHEIPVDALGDVGVSVDFTLPMTAGEHAALRRAMRELTQAERDLLWARHVEGLLPQEIIARGGIGDVTPGALRVFLSRAADKLRRRYEAQLGESRDDPLLSQLR